MAILMTLRARISGVASATCDSDLVSIPNCIVYATFTLQSDVTLLASTTYRKKDAQGATST